MEILNVTYDLHAKLKSSAKPGTEEDKWVLLESDINLSEAKNLKNVYSLIIKNGEPTAFAEIRIVEVVKTVFKE